MVSITVSHSNRSVINCTGFICTAGLFLQWMNVKKNEGCKITKAAFGKFKEKQIFTFFIM
jgi:hypothetical protein